MKILIELEGGCVTTVWASEPEGVEVVLRDRDDVFDDPENDPLKEQPELRDLRKSRNQVY